MAIDVSKIDKVDQTIIASSFLELATEYFANPEHQKAFEIWLKERKKERRYF